MTENNGFSRLLSLSIKGDANVLLTGPTGAGKSTLARKIHDGSRRAGKPFVAINLATLHEGTFESELFGHERGAFTGADQKRIGKLELGQGGTVFLDEVGELTPRMQARLLVFLQSRRITPMGGNREMQLDVRVVAATHRNLDQEVKLGRFREDLFHRLRVIVIPLRSLFEQRENFDSIVHQILDELCERYSCKILRLSEEVAERLEAHRWPGNFRELRNVLEYAVMASDGETISAVDLPSWFVDAAPYELCQATDPALGMLEIPLSLDHQQTMIEVEKIYLQRALHRYRGRIGQTARGIGMNKATLLRRLGAYGINPNKAENQQVLSQA